MGLAMVESKAFVLSAENFFVSFGNEKLFIAARKFLASDNLSFEGTPGIIISVGTKAFNCN